MDKTIAVQVFDKTTTSRVNLSDILCKTEFSPIFHSELTNIDYDARANMPCCCMFRIEPFTSSIDDVLVHSLSKNSKHVVLYAERPQISDVVYAMRQGAFDFLELPFKELEVIASLNRVVDQKRFILDQTLSASSTASRLARLTMRENSILEQIMLGNRNKVIAHNLGISQRTVENHRLRVMSKMEARSTVELLNMVNNLNKIQQNIGVACTDKVT